MNLRRATARVGVLGVLIAGGLALTATTAAAHAPHNHSHAKAKRLLGASAVPTAAGLYRIVPPGGPPVLTHGVDPAPPATATGRAATARPDLLGPGAPERAPLCASSNYTQVLYGRLATDPNRYGQVKGELQGIVRRMNAVLNAESIASGGGSADLRVACDGGGISVGLFTAPQPNLTAVIAGVRAGGFTATAGVNYLVFFDAAVGGCGIGTYEADERPIATNENNDGGGYAIAFPRCWHQSTPLHELGHVMGAVQPGAPQSTGHGGHCIDEVDVLCYSPDGGDRNQNGTISRCPAERFDCGFDDYFDAAPEPGEYLATHWNVGSPLNRFISFGAAAPPLDLGGIAGTLLRRGQARGRATGGAAAPGHWVRSAISIPRRARVLRVTLRGEGARLALYVRRGSPPTARRFACRRRLANHRATCRIPTPKPGRWVAGVLTRSGAAGAPIALSAKIERRRR